MCMGTEDYMKKKFLSILMAATMAASLAACGNADNKPAAESSSVAETGTERKHRHRNHRSPKQRIRSRSWYLR